MISFNEDNYGAASKGRCLLGSNAVYHGRSAPTFRDIRLLPSSGLREQCAFFSSDRVGNAVRLGGFSSQSFRTQDTTTYRRSGRFLTFTLWTPTITQTQLNTFIKTTNSDVMFEQSVVSGLWMSGAIPLFPLYAFISWIGSTFTLLFHLYTMHVSSSTSITKICDHH